MRLPKPFDGLGDSTTSVTPTGYPSIRSASGPMSCRGLHVRRGRSSFESRMRTWEHRRRDRTGAWSFRCARAGGSASTIGTPTALRTGRSTRFHRARSKERLAPRPHRSGRFPMAKPACLSRLWQLLVLSVVVSGCAESAGPLASIERAPSIAEAQGQSQDDPGLRMRLALRARPDAALERMVADHGNIVGIAFRQPGSARGVDDRGRSLVPPDVAATRANDVAALASRVLYRFRDLPAMLVELPNPGIATQLRRMPWVDYVVPNTALLSSDVVQGCTPFQMAQQIVHWNVTRVRADLAWSQATGTNGELLVLDDGMDLSQSYPNGWQDWPWNSGHSYGAAGVGSPTGAHGTLVMSAAVARNNGIGIVGIAPGAVLSRGDIAGVGGTTAWQNAAAWIINAAVPQTKVVS